MRKILLIFALGLLSACSSNDLGEQVSQSTQNASISTIQSTSNLHQNEQTKTEGEQKLISVTINQQQFSIQLENNTASQAFRKKLPLEITMADVNRNEKFFLFDQAFPTDEVRPGQIQAGDLMLYGDNGLVLFYENFSSSYSYTRLGHMENASGLKEALGSGNVTIIFEEE